MFTYQQFMSALRWGMTMAGTALVSVGVAPDGAIWQAVTGVVVAGAPFIWSMIRHTKFGTILAADEIPEVAGVIMKQTTEGRAMAADVGASKLPGAPTVVVAGTVAAAGVAQASPAGMHSAAARDARPL